MHGYTLVNQPPLDVLFGSHSVINISEWDVERSTSASLDCHLFARIIRRVGLQGVRFHDLRHTFASLMLLRGAKPKVISEALGHASVAFTVDVYSHIVGGMQEEAYDAARWHFARR